MVKIVAVALPEYTVATEPDGERIGRVLDAVVVAHFAGEVALRGISLADHPGQTLSLLTDRIVALGTDRYDPTRRPVLAEFYEPYGVALHAIPCTITGAGQLLSSHATGSVLAEFVGDFYTGPPVDRGGVPLRVDLILVYDRAQLEPIAIDYGTGPEDDPTAFRFRDPVNKPAALLGLIQVL